MSTDSQLAVVVQESGLPESTVKNLMQSFLEDSQKADEIIQEAKNITVTSENQTEIMAKAREKRLLLKNIRVNVEHTRKELKEQSLREGKAIDGMANIIKAIVMPVENYLEKQEKFADIKAAERKANRLAKRIGLLSPFVENTSLYNLDDMEDEAFDKLLQEAKDAHKARIEAAKKAEAERLAKEEADRKEQERVRQENEKLKAQAAETERLNNLDRKVRSFYTGDYKNVAEVEKALKDLEQFLNPLNKTDAAYVKQSAVETYTKLKDEIVFIEDSEAKAKELEAERKAREEAEAKIKADEEAKKQAEAAEAERKRKMLLGADVEKLTLFADQLDALEYPLVTDEAAKQLVVETKDYLTRITKNLRAKAKEL